MWAPSRLCALGALPILAACGGASTGATSFDEVLGLAASYQATLADPDAGAAQLTNAASLPNTGTAGFTGVMTVASSDALAAAGSPFVGVSRTTLTVDFGAGQVTGRTGQFYEVGTDSAEVTADTLTGTPLAGDLDFTLDAAIDGVNFYSGTVSGTLTQGNGDRVAVQTEISGGVMGSAGQTFRAVSLEDADYAVDVSALKN